MTLPFTWLITKSQPHADSVVIQLRRQGFTALALPCIDHQWLDWAELRQIGSHSAALLFVTSRAAAARIEVPQGTLVAAIAPTTSATLESRGIRVSLSVRGGVRELARHVVESKLLPDSAEIFYPTSDAALRQPEHVAAVSTLSTRFRVHTKAVYSTVAPAHLSQELTALSAPGAAVKPPFGYVFWSPSAIENFSGARGFQLPAGPVVLIGGSSERCWREVAPPAWRRAYKHDAETPLEWSLRFLERGADAAEGS